MKLTPWFPSSSVPSRDGIYITRAVTAYGALDCWHAMRWHGDSCSWYSAGTTGSRQEDAIGGYRPNHLAFQWRGLATKDGK